MRKIKGIGESKDKYFLEKNRGKKNENKITWKDIKSFAKMQLASGINRALAALDGLENGLNGVKELEENEK